MGFVSSLLGIANKVGGIANKFVNHAGIVGKIASGVNKAANLVSSVIPKVSPVINAITTGAKIAYQSGLADKLTNGKATRFVKGLQNMFAPKKGIQHMFAPKKGIQQNNAAVIHQAGATSGSAEMAKIM